MSIIEEKQDRLDGAVSWIDRMLAAGTRDADHLSRAVELYARAQNKAGLENALTQLGKVDEARARVAELDETTRSVLGIPPEETPMLRDASQ